MSPRKPRNAAQKSNSYESHFDYAALFEFSTVINSSIEPHFIFSHILLTIMGKILATRGMVLLLNPGSKKEYTVEMIKGFSGNLGGKKVKIPRMPHSLVSLDSPEASRTSWASLLRSWGIRILLPMVIADQPIGVLCFGDRVAGKKLQSREKTYLRSLANISATAIEKSRTIGELQQVNRKLDRKIQELNTLFDLGKEFGALLDPDKIVRLLVFSLLGQVGVSRYLVCLREGPDMRVAASRTDGNLPQGELLASLAKLKTPTLVADMIVRQGSDPRPVLTDMGLSVVVPMQLQGEIRGLIIVGDKLNREPFSPGDLEFLSLLGNVAIISLENARLFKEALEKQRLEDELLIARDIQKGLLPSVLPSIPDIEIAATNISSKQVGGDYYDVIAAPGGRYIIAIGDVSGKGTPAALLMANLQATIRALVPLNLPLAELTERVNDLMCENTGGNKFVTFFWAMLDPGTMNLTYVNAGHNYPYLLHANGTIVRLDKGGMILGVMKTTSPYEQESVTLRTGDMLVLFTDGVSEAMSKDMEEFGEERLEAVVRAHAGLNAQALTVVIHEHLQEFTKGAPQSDDITMMIMKHS
jgi:sigma-B regulation protein RsbU (phosphoserine phosphatase)